VPIDPAAAGPGLRFSSPSDGVIITMPTWVKAPTRFHHHLLVGAISTARCWAVIRSRQSLWSRWWRRACGGATWAIPPRCGRGMGDRDLQDTPRTRQHGDGRIISATTAPMPIGEGQRVPYIQTDAPLIRQQWRSLINAGGQVNRFCQHRHSAKRPAPASKFFAIPVNCSPDRAPDPRDRTGLTPPNIGVRLQALTPSWPGRINATASKCNACAEINGVVIVRSAGGSPAEKGGLEPLRTDRTVGNGQAGRQPHRGNSSRGQGPRSAKDLLVRVRAAWWIRASIPTCGRQELSRDSLTRRSAQPAAPGAWCDEPLAAPGRCKRRLAASPWGAVWRARKSATPHWPHPGGRPCAARTARAPIETPCCRAAGPRGRKGWQPRLEPIRSTPG